MNSVTAPVIRPSRQGGTVTVVTDSERGSVYISTQRRWGKGAGNAPGGFEIGVVIMVRDNVISFEQSAGAARRRLLDAKSTELVAVCRLQVADILPRLIQGLFEHLDDELFQMADKSGSDALQTQYFDALRELRKLRGAIETDFLAKSLFAYDGFWRGASKVGATPGHASEGELTLELVGEDELEENLAISGMVSKTASRFHRELFALNMRFAQVLGVAEVSDEENPVAPGTLAEVFRQSLAQWPGNVGVKLIVYKLFERHVMAYVGGLYDDINDHLIAGGILPKIVQRVRRNPVAPSVQRSRTSEPESGGEGAHGGADHGGTGGLYGAGMSHGVLGVLGELLMAHRRSGGASVPGLDHVTTPGYAQLPEVPSDELLGALDALQTNSFGSDALSIEDVRQAQHDMLASLGRKLDMGSRERPAKRFARAEQDVLDVMGMLFEFILEDDNLPDPMKALLARLQIPMLKVAVIDRSFFGSKSHPARRLLNRLARAAVGWVDDGDRSHKGLYGQIESVVVRVLNEFSGDVRVFEQINEDFAAYLERETRSAEVSEERIAQVNRGQEQLQSARKCVKAKLAELVTDAVLIPESVGEILRDGWHDLMLLAYLREGEGSDAWKNAYTLAERLIWSVQPKQNQDERQRLLKIIPELLKTLRQGLENISFDQHRASRLFKDLQVCHITALRGGQVAASNVPVVESIPSAQATDTAPVDDSFHTAALALKLGDWLEWEIDGVQLRGKLSWRSEVSGRCIFVNRKGAKIAEMTVAGIASLLRDGQAKCLADVATPWMDRALEAMVEALNETAQPA